MQWGYVRMLTVSPHNNLRRLMQTQHKTYAPILHACKVFTVLQFVPDLYSTGRAVNPECCSCYASQFDESRNKLAAFFILSTQEQLAAASH